MLTGSGRGLVKQVPHESHCTTANHSPSSPPLGSWASISGVQYRPAHCGQGASSQVTCGRAGLVGVGPGWGTMSMATILVGFGAGNVTQSAAAVNRSGAAIE